MDCRVDGSRWWGLFLKCGTSLHTIANILDRNEIGLFPSFLSSIIDNENEMKHIFISEKYINRYVWPLQHINVLQLDLRFKEERCLIMSSRNRRQV